MEYLLQTMMSISPYTSNPYSVYQLKVLNCKKNYQDIANIAQDYWHQNFTVVHTRLFCHGYLNSGNYSKARELANKLKVKSKNKQQAYRLLGIISAFEGDTTSVLAYVDGLNQLSTKMYIANVYIASLYAAIGDKNKMYRYLELALSNGEKEIHSIMHLDEFIPYHKEAHFMKIWAKCWIPR
jgi:hypothetical protein